MTVIELIAALQLQEPDVPVRIVVDDDYYDCEVSMVSSALGAVELSGNRWETGVHG